MLISFKHKLIIATPTKTGTTSLETAVKAHVKHGGKAIQIVDWESPRRQHRMCLPEHVGYGRDIDLYARYIVLRNPYSRWLSVFKHLSRPGWNQWAARQIQRGQWTGAYGPGKPSKLPRYAGAPMRFDEFLVFVAEQRALMAYKRPPLNSGSAYRAPWVWIDRLDESWRFLMLNGVGGPSMPVKAIHTETLWDDFAKLGIDGFSEKEYHSNRSPDTVRGSAADMARIQKLYRQHDLCGPMDKAADGCQCGACLVGIAAESATLMKHLQPRRTSGRKAHQGEGIQGRAGRAAAGQHHSQQPVG